ncbi:hypothetical protein YC2023_048368 [Brassica napus]
MDSNTQNHLYDPNHVSSSSGSGLLRFRSAPSSVLAASDETVFNSNEFENKSRVSYAAAPPPQQEPSSFLGLPPHYPKQSNGMMMMNTSGLDQFLSMNNHHHTRQAESHPLRQSSSPAGLFTNLSDQNGAGYGYVGEEEEEEESPSHPNGLRRHSSLFSRPPSSLGMFPQIPEIDSESVQFSHWNDPSSFIDNLSSLKRETEDDRKLFHGAQMSHRLRLPKSSSTASDMVSVDKYLQLQDSVPCKIRAKRGCATHPRSIAERVRRTKISERMRKLQELVPNMDKQTNTSDMLDLAVDYIKDLQRQYKILNENRANCKCVNKEKNLI